MITRDGSTTLTVVRPELHYKDAVLDKLAEIGNVAQFVSFGPGGDPPQRYSRVHGMNPNSRFDSLASAIGALLAASPEHSVNVRSFDPNQPKAHEFLYGLRSTDEVLGAVRRLASSGLHTIVNETIDVNDGGVSGVAFGDIIEFAPGDTPRAVEKPGTVAFAREPGLRLLELVYGFQPKLDYPAEARVEFSLHPIRRGVRKDHTIVWELEHVGQPNLSAQLRWPNHFSRLVGDKAFGLIVAATLGLDVPATTVIPRKLPPFHFGRSSASGETWLRTCPPEPVPGHFTTSRGWVDPFSLLREEDETGHGIASVLAQEGVDALFAGAVVTDSNGLPVIEGVAGTGDEFMLGRRAPETLPADIVERLTLVFGRAKERLGPISFEWAFDGRSVWVLQLHQAPGAGGGSVVYAGTPSVEHRFDVGKGLEELRSLAAKLRGTGDGVVLVGDVGVTSHFGDVLRKAEIPSRIERLEVSAGS
jgi:hypothetical protein